MDPGLVLVHRVQDGLQDNVVDDIDLLSCWRRCIFSETARMWTSGGIVILLDFTFCTFCTTCITCTTCTTCAGEWSEGLGGCLLD